MEEKNKKNIDRRRFLKVLGGSTLASTASLYSCKPDKNASFRGNGSSDIPAEMTYRTTPTTGDKVSLLGYGCMRWPTVSNSSARDSSDEIDQEMVNRLVDYAIAHGINYFDTSPAYCKGRRSMPQVSLSAVIRAIPIILPPNYPTSRPRHGAVKTRWLCIVTL